MVITIDFSQLFQILLENPLYFVWYVFLRGGWMILLYALASAFFYFWLHIRRKKYLDGIEHVLLAIDIPKDNEQSMLAVEQIFATLAGIKGGFNKYEKFWLGKTQLSMSLEIISFEGYIQFLLRTPVQYRDLAEAAIYAQYPDAEITEVEDYVNMIPDNAAEMGTEFQFWGSELNLEKFSAYPLKTYKLFEHSLAQVFIDPMASLLEVMSKLGPGEQLGLQIVIAPAGEDWKKRGISLIKKLIGDSSHASVNLSDKVITKSLEGLEKFSEAVYKLWGDIKTKEKDTEKNLYQQLTTNQKFVVEMIENKLAKICFASSIRIYYYAHNEAFKRGRGVNAVIGALNQFNSSDLNSIKKYGVLTTDRDYLFARQRVARVQKKFVKLFKNRSRKGSPEFYLSIEELATLYHFPTITVKAPLLQKIVSKKAEPPIALPLEQLPVSQFFKAKKQEEREAVGLEATEPYLAPSKTSKIGAGEKKFVITESLQDYDFDNDYFEEQFGKSQNNAIKPQKTTPANAVKRDAEMEIPPDLTFVD